MNIDKFSNILKVTGKIFVESSRIIKEAEKDFINTKKTKDNNNSNLQLDNSNLQ